jgi:3-phosphoshikimate 1-carboxyvinyltransferase
MKLRVRPGRIGGEVRVPGSKSHTIRGLILGMLAEGESLLRCPLVSSDTESCVRLCRALGGEVETGDTECWRLRGTGGSPRAAAQPVDVGNSGTTLFLGMGAAALADGLTELTGDEQTRRRSAGPLLEALSELGATAYSRDGSDCAPLVVGGGLRGGSVSIECPTSQYLSSLLIAVPCAGGESEITAPLLNEKPYVAMTCQWLDETGIEYHTDHALQHFVVPGGQHYRCFDRAVPGDFSSATFFLVAAAVTGSELMLRGLDMADTQGDKATVGMVREMGCEVDVESGAIRLRGPERLRGAAFDLNATPDALPAMAVAGAVAEGETRLVNVPQARQKETDRLSVIAEELGKMGARIRELPSGLIIQGGRLQGAEVDGHGDHRVVMALALAGLAAEGETTVRSAEAVRITFPEFPELMQDVGAQVKVEDG